MQRLLHVASESPGSSQRDGAANWLQLLGSRLQQQGAVGAAGAIEAHWRVLQQHTEQLLACADNSQSSVSLVSQYSLGADAEAGSLAAAYLSLSTVLQQAAGHSSWHQLCSACPPLQQVDWTQVHAGSVHGHAAGLVSCRDGVSAVAGMQNDPQQQAVLACSAAAVGLLPQHPAPWKGYGDLLFQLASSSAQVGTEAAETASALPAQQQDPRSSQQHQQQVAATYAAAAEAYCQHLATSANSGCLSTPQQGLGVLLKLLQIILQQGEQLHGELSCALGTCPAAVWQVLTNQLLAQLQHSSVAVRGLIKQLLQGLAVVVPCAVLYPLVVEVRVAQEAGQEVRRTDVPCLPLYH
jgi:hypothetical protein